jgi:Fas apoptotic inhibitory molecule (FAIM1)/Protein of unknown function (DUF3592)
VAHRRWEFDLDDGRHLVAFEQGYFTGNRKITVDGTTINERGSPFQNHSGQYPISLGGHGAAIWVSTNGFAYSFDLVVDGRSVTSGRTATRVPRPQEGSPRYQQAGGIVLIVLGLPFLAFAGKGLSDEYRYSTASSIAVGTVEGRSTSTGRYGPNYAVSYVFADSTGAVWRGGGSVSESRYRAAQPGSRIEVEYLRDDPGTNRVLGENQLSALVVLGALGLVSAAVGIYTFLEGRRRAGILLRVNMVGQPVDATVTRVKSAHSRVSGQVVTVEYEYDDPFGNRRKGRGPLMYPAEGGKYAAGERVRVLIDPERPQDSVLP